MGEDWPATARARTGVRRLSGAGGFAAGQVRWLHPELRDGRGRARLVVVAGCPRSEVLPADVSVVPGPCRMVQVLLLRPGPVTVRDLRVPAGVPGVPEGWGVWLDALSSVRLEPGVGLDRFGPLVGQLPAAVPGLARALLSGSRARAVAAVEALDADGRDWRTGLVEPQPGDPVWRARGREVANLGRLAAWW